MNNNALKRLLILGGITISTSFFPSPSSAQYESDAYEILEPLTLNANRKHCLVTVEFCLNHGILAQISAFNTCFGKHKIFEHPEEETGKYLFSLMLFNAADQGICGNSFEYIPAKTQIAATYNKKSFFISPPNGHLILANQADLNHATQKGDFKIALQAYFHSKLENKKIAYRKLSELLNNHAFKEDPSGTLNPMQHSQAEGKLDKKLLQTDLKTIRKHIENYTKILDVLKDLEMQRVIYIFHNQYHLNPAMLSRNQIRRKMEAQDYALAGIGKYKKTPLIWHLKLNEPLEVLLEYTPKSTP